MSKRKFTNKKSKNNSDIDDISKKRKLSNNTEHDWKFWVYATETRNYMLKDPFLDFVRLYPTKFIDYNSKYKKYIRNNATNSEKNFTNILMEKGLNFENQVIQLLKKKVGKNNFINISGNENPRSNEKYLNTCKAIKSGIPFIYSGVLHNSKNQTYGIPDLIVRSDWLNKMVLNPCISRQEENIHANNLSGRYHYRIVEIKNTTLSLLKDGIHLSNNGTFQAYKAQVYIYNKALTQIQGYDSQISYILGSRWKYKSNKKSYTGNYCFDRLAILNFSGHDFSYIDRTYNSILWLKDLKKYGSKWSLKTQPLPRSELYPNMSNKLDKPYTELKKKFAEDICEITLLWQCGIKHRTLAHRQNIYSWKDPQLNPNILGFKKGNYNTILQKILEVNNSSQVTFSTNDVIYPKIIQNNFRNWQTPQIIEVYVDFETTSRILSNSAPYSNIDTLIYMIGIGYISPSSKKWIYKSFIVNSLNNNQEFNICNKFNIFVHNISQKYKCNPLIIHWGHAEKSSWKRVYTKNLIRSKSWSHVNWFDLFNIFKSEPIIIKGCLSFGLKNIVSSLASYSLINSSWDNTLSCLDGTDAAVSAYLASPKNFKKDPYILDVKKYNEIDCKVLHEIISYLRKYHTTGKNSLDATFSANNNHVYFQKNLNNRKSYLNKNNNYSDDNYSDDNYLNKNNNYLDGNYSDDNYSDENYSDENYSDENYSDENYSLD